jgi:hypothetical protein
MPILYRELYIQLRLRREHKRKLAKAGLLERTRLNIASGLAQRADAGLPVTLRLVATIPFVDASLFIFKAH